MVQKIKGSKFPWKAQARDHSGRVVSKQFAKKDEAERFEAKVRGDRQLVRSGLEMPKSEILLIDYFKGWMKIRSKGKRSTWEMDDCRFRNHIAEKFGNRAMATISSGEWKEHLDWLMTREADPLSKATRNRIRALLHKLYKDAFMSDMVVFNPISKIPLLKESAKKRHIIWTEKQREDYIAAMYADPEHGAYAGLFAVISVFEGPRISEVMALRNSSIDEENELIWLTEIYEQCSHNIEKRTKGDEAGRSIPLFPRVADALRAHRLAHPHKAPDAFLFAKDGKHPISTFAMRNAHERVVGALKLPRTTPHGNRHLFTSMAEEAGFSTFERKEILGHSTIAMTERYTHTSTKKLTAKGRELGFGEIPRRIVRLKRK